MDIGKHVKYHLRWQAGFFVCFPCMWLFSDILELPLWLAVVMFQFVGALIFYQVDSWIFSRQKKRPSSII